MNLGDKVVVVVKKDGHLILRTVTEISEDFVYLSGIRQGFDKVTGIPEKTKSCAKYKFMRTATEEEIKQIKTSVAIRNKMRKRLKIWKII